MAARGLRFIVPLLGVVLLSVAPPTSGQEPEQQPASVPVRTAPSDPRAAAKTTTRQGVSRATLVDLVRTANPLLWPLGLCSVVAVGYALERFIALRKGRVIPREFIERFLDRLAAGKLDRERAIELCKANESPAARVFGRVAHYWGQPAAAIREAVAHDLGAEVAELKRNVRVLNATATIAPLLGLLGTVVGMIESFDALAGRTGNAGKGEALAHGISLALMATAVGLAIAVVSVTLYYYLIGRVDALAHELDTEATKVIDLVAGDAGRVGADRRVGGPNDLARHEPVVRG